MLLNYLYGNFYEETEFLEKIGKSASHLSKLTLDKVLPKPSYILEIQTDLTSFIGEHNEHKTYRFHLKGYVGWAEVMKNLGICSEERAKAFFRSEYKAVAEMFFTGHFGSILAEIIPDLPAAFDEAYFEATWGHFMDGVYGVYTKDGMPRSIFFKQALVMFVDGFTQRFPDPALSQKDQEILERAVAMLDGVESDFAPHEVAGTSRQRCITCIKEKYLLG